MKSIYNLEINSMVQEIKKTHAKSVLIQFPDGLKSYAGEVVDEIKKKTKILPIIWFGSCFGACDIPISMAKKVDVVFQIGHNRFIKNPQGWRTK